MHESHIDIKQTIHEHKAPTDDSIRLAEEFAEKQREKIVANLPFDNELKGSVVIFSNDFTSYCLKAYLSFELNGVPFLVKKDISILDLESYKGEEAARWLINEVGEAIKEELASTIISNSGKF